MTREGFVGRIQFQLLEYGQKVGIRQKSEKTESCVDRETMLRKNEKARSSMFTFSAHDF